MTDALKPCPFCGGPVRLELANESTDRIYGRRQWWGVVCRNTKNLGGTCAIQQRPSASQEAAIERWNRRALPAPVTDAELAAIYKRANGEDVGKAQPLTTARIFRAMRAMLEPRK